MRTDRRGEGPRVLPGVLSSLAVVVVGCGPAPGPVAPAPAPADTAPASPEADAAVEAPPEAPGRSDAVESPPESAEPRPPGPVPPGFDALELPPGVRFARVLWQVDGPLTADDVRGTLAGAIGGIDACLGPAGAGQRLPMHFIVGASGRVEEVGGPLVEDAPAQGLTCAQGVMRLMRFPGADADTTVRLAIEW